MTRRMIIGLLLTLGVIAVFLFRGTAFRHPGHPPVSTVPPPVKRIAVPLVLSINRWEWRWHGPHRPADVGVVITLRNERSRSTRIPSVAHAFALVSPNKQGLPRFIHFWVSHQTHQAGTLLPPGQERTLSIWFSVSHNETVSRHWQLLWNYAPAPQPPAIYPLPR